MMNFRDELEHYEQTCRKMSIGEKGHIYKWWARLADLISDFRKKSESPWRIMQDAPRDGRPILVVLETPEETIHGDFYPVEREYVVVRYKPAPFRSSQYGAFVWRQNEGSAIAEHVPVAWREIEEFEGW